jgi:hypothetical protein
MWLYLCLLAKEPATMEVTKIAVKLFAARPVPELREFIPVFHRWIQTHAVEDHLLIDVADYAHVVAGPGVVLVASEANFYFDFSGNRPGLLYTRKTASPGSLGDRLRVAVASCVKAAVLLEQDAVFVGRLRFDTSELSIRLNDRLLAPNNDATYAEIKPDIESLAADLYGGSQMKLERRGAKENLFEVAIKSNSSPTTASLLEKLGALAR